MSEDDGEIEYLEEDEELVQQYVQSAPAFETVYTPAPMHQVFVPKKKSSLKRKRKASVSTESEFSDSDTDASDLLSERKFNESKRKKVSSDSDYDPYEDMYGKKRDPSQKKRPPKKQTPTIITSVMPNSITLVPSAVSMKEKDERKRQTIKPSRDHKTPAEKLEQRKRLDICIPDFEDPLCLPARAIKKEPDDYKLLNRWNNLCLERLKTSHCMLKANKESAVSSTRSVVFQNISDKTTGKVETWIWGKTLVYNEGKKVKKSDMFNSILPRFKDSNIRRPYKLSNAVIKKFHHRDEVIITKEEYKEDKMLVVYRPSDAVSAIYKKIVDHVKLSQSDEEDKRLMILKEVCCCKVCAACYHASWRGAKFNSLENMNIKCALCHCTFVSVYNLLSHLKLHHTAADVRQCREQISKVLAKLIDYHYKCRLCQEEFLAIKDLRKHISTHKGTTQFMCEVGNHLTY